MVAEQTSLFPRLSSSYLVVFWVPSMTLAIFCAVSVFPKIVMLDFAFDDLLFWASLALIFTACIGFLRSPAMPEDWSARGHWPCCGVLVLGSVLYMISLCNVLFDNFDMFGTFDKIDTFDNSDARNREFQLCWCSHPFYIASLLLILPLKALYFGICVWRKKLDFGPFDKLVLYGFDFGIVGLLMSHFWLEIYHLVDMDNSVKIVVVMNIVCYACLTVVNWLALGLYWLHENAWVGDRLVLFAGLLVAFWGLLCAYLLLCWAFFVVFVASKDVFDECFGFDEMFGYGTMAVGYSVSVQMSCGLFCIHGLRIIWKKWGKRRCLGDAEREVDYARMNSVSA